MLVDGVEVAALRRRVGPVAWCALEVLVTRGRVSAGGIVVEASVRLVAVELAVANNTAQRALKTLRSAGVVEPAQGRRAGGRFGATTYRLHLPAEIQRALLPIPKPSGQPRRSSQAEPVHVGEQLVLVPSA
jgi:DNA-binding transcriptional MocR family regulator